MLFYQVFGILPCPLPNLRPRNNVMSNYITYNFVDHDAMLRFSGILSNYK